MHVSVKVEVAVRFERTSVPLVDLVPVQAPDALQLVALAVLQVSVDEPPLVTVVGDAPSVTVGADGGVTVTVTDWLAEPTLPVQVSVNVVVAVRAPVDAEPDVPRLPLQPPDAVQLVALVDDQLSVDEPPCATAGGAALSMTVGRVPPIGDTVTVTDCAALPPAPAHVSVNVVVAVSPERVSEPLVGFAPLQPPLAVQVVAFAAVQLNVLAPPLLTVVGAAVSVIDGAGAASTVMLTDCAAVPPAPVQVNMKVVFAVNPERVSDPLIAFEPLQPPLAVQLVVFWALHDSVVEPPYATVVGVAVRVTVGAVGDVTETFTDCVAEPARPVQVNANDELAVSGPVDAVPAIGFAPLQLPEAVHAVALVDDHVSVAAEPEGTDGGVTVNDTVGAAVGGAIPAITVSAAVPPAPLQVSV